MSTNLNQLAIVIVTYQRQLLLQQLLDSISRLNSTPWLIVIVDNENSEDTKQIANIFTQTHQIPTLYHAMSENTGGAGGFSKGVELAYQEGAEWFWIMDDDVEVMPNAIELMDPFADKYQAIQSRRWDFDNTPLYWQYHFSTSLGILSPIARKDFGRATTIPVQQICFEGGLIHREIVEQIGFPDARFFIYWDDVIYGYLASKVTPVVYADIFTLKRTRILESLKFGARKLRSSSDLTRYYIMRNRGYMYHYLKMYGDLNPFTFAFGTFLTWIKEAIRIIKVDHSGKSSFSELLRGLKDARKLKQDSSWSPPNQLII